MGSGHDEAHKQHYHSLRIKPTVTARITCYVGYRRQNSCNAHVVPTNHARLSTDNCLHDEYAKRVDYKATLVHTKARQHQQLAG